MNHDLILTDEIAFWKENLKYSEKEGSMYIELNLPSNFKINFEQIKGMLKNPVIDAKRDEYQGLPLKTFTRTLSGVVVSPELKAFIKSL